MVENKKLYIFFITFYLCIFILCMIFFFLVIPTMITIEDEGFFIIPGGAGVENGLMLIIIAVFTIIIGLLTFHGLMPVILRVYMKSFGRKKKVGLVQREELNKKRVFLRIWIRAIFLAFFMMNIGYTLASQELIIRFWRSVNPSADFMIPDLDTMFGLVTFLCIPCTFLLVPLWYIEDTGLATAKKVRGVELEATSLVGSRLYKLIKGYTGIGFIYNLTVQMITWIIPEILKGSQTVIMQVILPLVAITLMFPIVVYIDLKRDAIRRKTELTLGKMEMLKEFTCGIELKDIKIR